jgi:hypothetical protein
MGVGRTSRVYSVILSIILAACSGKNGFQAASDLNLHSHSDPILLSDDVLSFDGPGIRTQAFLTGDVRTDALYSGYRWYTGTVTYSFYNYSVFRGAYTASTIENPGEVSERVKANVRNVMLEYSSKINLNLIEVQETSQQVGQIRILLTSSVPYAAAGLPVNPDMWSASADIFLNPSYQVADGGNGYESAPGSHGYLTLVHEHKYCDVLQLPSLSLALTTHGLRSANVAHTLWSSSEFTDTNSDSNAI